MTHAPAAAPHFPADLRQPVVSALTGQTYLLVRVDAALPQRAVQDITRICNEPPVYDWLFRARRQGRPYTQQEAQDFLDWARAGWRSGTHFVFLVLGPQGEGRPEEVVAALDLKSPDLDDAEVGYWASGAHRGLMTGALRAMLEAAEEAGFRRVWACPQRDNARSVALLERAGFRAFTPPEGAVGAAYDERRLG